MSRKKTQPKKNIIPDPKFNSTIIPKLILEKVENLWITNKLEII